MDEREEFLIQEYVDGELDEAQVAEVEALLAQSVQARQFLDGLRTLNRQFGMMEDVPLTTDLSAQIGQRVEAESAAPLLWMRLLLLVQVVVATILLWQLWPQMSAWLQNGRIALDTLFNNIQLPTITFDQLWLGWETAVFEQTDQLLPVINLPPQQWAMLIVVVSVIWLAGNRLLFTNNNGGSHG